MYLVTQLPKPYMDFMHLPVVIPCHHSMERGKKPCWDIFQLFSEFIPAFRVLSEISPTKEDIDAIFPLLNKFTARLYQNNDEFQDVDSLRLLLLIHKGKSFDSMPPGSDSLKLKSYRAGYQEGHNWGNMLVPIMNPPSPSEWVWIETPHSWVPQYTNLDIISRNLPTLTLCLLYHQS